MTHSEVVKALRIPNIIIANITIDNKNANNKVPIKYAGNSLVFQTPFLQICSCLRKTAFPNIHLLETTFKGDSDDKINQWFQFIENIEDHVSSLVTNVGTSWFAQQDVNIKSLIRDLDPSCNTHFIKWPINLENNIFIDEYKQPFDYTKLKVDDRIKMIIEVSDLWINENVCGLAVIVQKILVKPYIQKICNDYIFEESDSDCDHDENEENIISLLATEQKPKIQIPSKIQPKIQPNPFYEVFSDEDELSITANKINEVRQIVQDCSLSSSNMNDDIDHDYDIDIAPIATKPIYKNSRRIGRF